MQFLIVLISVGALRTAMKYGRRTVVPGSNAIQKRVMFK